MSPARACATVAVALACAAQSPAPSPSPDQILARIKFAFRAHPRPPYVVYTLSRRDSQHGLFDLENSYTLRVWCRTRDRAALTRRVDGGRTYGPLEFIVVAFDGMVDPGPPTADVFERALFASAPRAPPFEPSPAQSALPVIGVVAAKDGDYRVRRIDREGDALHLALEPRTDPERNRIDDLWVDATTYEIRRIRVRDHLYLGFSGGVLDDEFDVTFAERDGLPLIVAVRGRTSDREYETDYRFDPIAFPETLPDWYFDPRSYGAHRADAP